MGPTTPCFTTTLTLPLARSYHTKSSTMVTWRKKWLPQPFTRRSTIASVSPPGKIAVVEIGTGVDMHGQSATKAAMRACRNAIEFNSLPGMERLVPDGDVNKMTVHVKLGVPKPFVKDVDEESVRQQFPYGRILVEVVEGGLLCGSGVILPDKGDAEGDDRAIIVIAAVSVIG